MQAYVGTAFSSISFANRAAAEVDIYGGIRPTFGALALDFGVWGYLYPGGQCANGTDGVGAGTYGACSADPKNIYIANGNVLKKDVSFYEIYAKATYNFSDTFAVGGSYFYSPNFLNFGFDSSYAGINAKWTTPTFMPWGIGSYVSGEFGYQWLGTADSFYNTAAGPTKVKDYSTWNVGVGFTKSVFTLDLRYSGTDMTKVDCNTLTSDWKTSSYNSSAGSYESNWCGDTFIAKLGVDLTAASNLK